MQVSKGGRTVYTYICVCTESLEKAPGKHCSDESLRLLVRRHIKKLEFFLLTTMEPSESFETLRSVRSCWRQEV
jgi:hypothetical protein